MQEINAKIVRKEIVSSEIDISPDLKNNIDLAMECRAKIKPPKNENDNSILLNMELLIHTKEDELKIKMVSNFIFELEQIPEQYDELAEKKLVPIARKELLDNLDEILVIMGYNKMNLSSKNGINV